MAHCDIAQSFIKVAKHIMPNDVSYLHALSVEPYNSLVELKQALANKCEQLGGEILILTDVKGASPYNAARVLQDEKVSVIAGLNLPMVLKALNHQKLPLEGLVEKVIEAGKEGIC